MPDSHTYPDLERVPGKQNWVDKSGGLPSYIERIAKHIHYEGGREIGAAIAAAVNTVKRWCHGGTVSKTGGPEVAHHVSAATVAKACKALAEWNAKKASHALSLGLDRDACSDLDLAEIFGDEIEAHLKLAAEGEFDEDEFALALAQERHKRGVQYSTEPLFEGSDVELNLAFEDQEDRRRLERFIESYKNYNGMPGLDTYESDEIELPGGYSLVPDHRGAFMLLDPDGEVCGWGCNSTDAVHAYQVARYA
jgi:hypothetical protein